MNSIVFIGRTVLESEGTSGFQRVGGSLFNTLLHLQSIAHPENFHFITNSSPALEPGFVQLKVRVHRINFTMTPLEFYENGYLSSSQDQLLDQQWTTSHLKAYEDYITSASIVVLDMYRADFILYVSRTNPRARIFLTGTSAELIRSIRPFAAKVSVLKIDTRQTKSLTNITVHDLLDCGMVQRELQEMGFRQAVVTLNRLGSYYFTEEENGHYHSRIISRNAFTHAGDAFFAGMIYAAMHGSALSIMALEGIHQSGNFIKKIMEANEAKEKIL